MSKEIKPTTVKITKGEIHTLMRAINELPRIKNLEVAGLLMRNTLVLDPECKILDKQKEPFESFNEFQKELKALQEEHADKGANGKPLLIPVNETMSKYTFADPDAFQVAGDELREKHKEAIDERNQQLLDISAEENKEIEINLYVKPLSLLVKNKIELDQKQLATINKIVGF